MRFLSHTYNLYKEKTMRNHLRLLSFWAALFTFTLVSGAASAQSPTYSSEFKSWEIVGNGYGETGSSDNFEDGTITEWNNLLGTVTETGGALVLQSPGVLIMNHFPSFNYAGYASSAQRNESGKFLSDGGGDFTITGVLRQEEIDTDLFVSINIGAASSGGVAPFYVMSAALQNFGPLIGGQPEFVEGFHAAIYVVTVSSIDSPTENTISDVQSVVLPLDYSNVSDDYELTLEFNDTTNTFSAFVSIDGAGGTPLLIGNLTMPATEWIGQPGLRVDPREFLAPSVPSLNETALITLMVLLMAAAYFHLRPSYIAPLRQ